jgi:hypothetical protein
LLRLSISASSIDAGAVLRRIGPLNGDGYTRDAIGEGITVSRPVKTIPISLHTFKSVEPEEPELEEWEFSFPFSRAMRSTDIKEKGYLLAVEKVSN